ncbi:uncharacterized protein [Rutidosis leptorrhynchoides]
MPRRSSGGLKKCSTNINMGTKQKPMKVCSNKNKKKIKGVVDKQVMEKYRNIIMGTKQKPMKVCSNKKKIEAVDKQVYLADAPILDKNVKSPNVYKVPLKEEDHKSWLEFKKLDEWRDPLTTIHDRLWKIRCPVKVDHPFVVV